MITNYLSPLEFQIAIKRIPNVEFFTQKISLPAVNVSPVERSGPMNKVFQTPDKMTYDELSLSFIVDEKMTNYLEIFNWLKGISAPESFDQYRRTNESDDGLYSDISVMILNSNKNANIEFTFYNCFPTSLSGVELDTTNTDVIYPESSVTFRYDYYEIGIK